MRDQHCARDLRPRTGNVAVTQGEEGATNVTLRKACVSAQHAGRSGPMSDRPQGPIIG